MCALSSARRQQQRHGQQSLQESGQISSGLVITFKSHRSITVKPCCQKLLGRIFWENKFIIAIGFGCLWRALGPKKNILTFCSFCWNRSLESVLLASPQETFSISCQCPSAWSNGRHQFLLFSCHFKLWLLVGFIKVLQGILVDLWPRSDPKVLHQVFLHRKIDGDFFVLVWHTELLLVLRCKKHSFLLLMDAGEGCIGILWSLFHAVLDRKRCNTHLYLFWDLICSFTSPRSAKLPSVVITDPEGYGVRPGGDRWGPPAGSGRDYRFERWQADQKSTSDRSGHRLLSVRGQVLADSSVMTDHWPA